MKKIAIAMLIGTMLATAGCHRIMRKLGLSHAQPTPAASTTP